MAEKQGNILFGILNALFTDKAFIEALTAETMKQNIFMINRRIAIKYPLQAQVFNNAKAWAPDIVKFWSDYLYSPGSRPPGWIYTSGAAKSKAEKDKNTGSVSRQLVKDYCNYYKVSSRDFDSAMHLFRDDTVAELKEFETFYKTIKNTDNETADN